MAQNNFNQNINLETILLFENNIRLYIRNDKIPLKVK